MNAARLKALIEDLLAAEDQVKIQDQLSNLASALQNFSGQPQDSNMQVEVSKKLNSLASQIAKLEGRWEPVQLVDLESIGALPFFSEAMVDGIKQSIADNSMTPAVVHKHVQQLAKKREQYLEVLRNSNRDLQTLGIGAETLDEGAAEIGFRIPRLLFDDNLEGLISELNVLRRIMRAFSELATGSAELGRGLINAQPQADAGQLDEGEIVSGELVVSGGDTPTLLDLIEEPLDQIAVPVKVRAEADRVLAIAFRRDVCPRALLAGERPDPVRVISSICQQHGSWLQSGQERQT